MCGLSVWVTCECMWRGEPDSWPLYIMHLTEVSQGQASYYILPFFPSFHISEAHEPVLSSKRWICTRERQKWSKPRWVFEHTRSFHVLMTIIDWLHSITVKIVNIIIRLAGLSGLHQSIMGEITLTKVVLTNRPQQVRTPLILHHPSPHRCTKGLCAQSAPLLPHHQ